jgi:hypothetical protein
VLIEQSTGKSKIQYERGHETKKNKQTKNKQINLGFEVLKAVNISAFVFWVITPCELVGRHQP